MRFRFGFLASLAALFVMPAVLHAQFNFTVGGKQLQVHSFASQGFAYSDENNFLSMKTTSGSGAFTDGGLNMSTNLTSKLRVGAQMYLRNVGELGNWSPKLDWAYVDYRFSDGFGVRAGKVKTALGLYNDTQDIDSLQTFALLPQGIYPLDVRDNFIAHTGVDFYGTIKLPRKNKLKYTVYAGMRSNDPEGGYYFGSAQAGVPLNGLGGNATGIDLRWETPVSGLTFGVSQMAQTLHAKGVMTIYHNAPVRNESYKPEQITAAYVDYNNGKWHLSGEVRRDKRVDHASVGPISANFDYSNKGWYVTAAYRVLSRLELGSYYSRYYVDNPEVVSGGAFVASTNPAIDHIFDQAVTAKVDINKFWYAKIEGHFMDGYGSSSSTRGFYRSLNPQGLQPKTNMLVIRTGFSF